MNKKALTACAAALALTAVSCGNNDRGDGYGHMYEAALSGNPASLDPQYANDPASNTVIKNMYSGLMAADESGKLTCRNALSYDVSEDGRVYTFHLRRDNYWFRDADRDDIIDEGEYFPVTAGDYVFALQRLLDPKMQSPYAAYYTCIKGGELIASGSQPPEAAGVFALDDYTLEIDLEYPSSEFLQLLAAPPASPCNKEFFNSTKGTYGLNDEAVMSNGAFYMRQWFYDPYGNHNILYMRKNDINANEQDPVIPSFLSFSIERDDDGVWQCMKDGSSECMVTWSTAYGSKKYSTTSKASVTLGLVFNQKEGYFRSESLRKALAYGIDRQKLADSLSDDVEMAYGVIPPAAMLSGRSYRELCSDRSFDRYAPDEAVKLLEKARTELGTGNFDNVKIMVCADSVDSAYLHLLSQNLQDELGIYIGVEDVTETEFRRRLRDGEYSLALYPLGGDLNTPLGVVGQFEKTDILAEASGGKKFTGELLRCKTVQDEVEACTAAEREILDCCGFIPVFYKNCYLIADKDNEDIAFDPFTGAVDYRNAKNYS